MSWPDKLNIAGIEYPVKYVALDQEVDSEIAEQAQGQITYCPRAIRVMAGCPTRHRRLEDIMETLLHEILHGVFEAAPLLVGEIFGDKEGLAREPVITELCRLLCDTLNRNNLLRIPRGRPEITKRN